VTTTRDPYIGLDHFVEEDADLFFGRDAERKRIIGNLQASRLTLLYAESGVGKSSLLRAGVCARLVQLAERRRVERGSPRYVPVVFSAWRGDAKAGLIAALERAVSPLLAARAQPPLGRDDLEQAIEDVGKAVDGTLLLILDQFEEHFLYESNDADGLDDEIARCINRPDLRANFLFSVREDAYSLVGQRFKARIPNVYANYLHLDFLDERAAHDAIVRPVDAFNRRAAADPPYEVETALVRAVIEQVRRGRVTIGDLGAPDMRAASPDRVETAYLQLVMKRLWDEEVAVGSRELRLETLRRLGGADTIVRSHLDDVMAELDDDQRDAAAAAFRFLVTSAGRKIALSSDELREFSEAPAQPLEAALDRLERKRILRPLRSTDPSGVRRREIYHDVLAPAILDWRRRHVEQRQREDAERRVAQARDQARHLEVRNRRLTAAVIALLAVASGLALYLWNPAPLRRLELQAVDARFSMRGSRAADPRLVLVAVDERTLSRLAPPGATQLSRPIYTRLLNRLRRDGPAVIALDVVFFGPKGDAVDGALLDAIRAANDRLVLAFTEFAVVPDVEGRLRVRAELLGRPAGVEATGVRTGFAGLPNDADDNNRRADYVVGTTANVDAQTIAFAAADVARHGELGRRLQSQPSAGCALPSAPRRAEGDQSRCTTWIDFRGPPGSIRRVPALDVIDGRVPRRAFKDEIVVVGVTAPTEPPDLHRTPLDGDRPMSGPELQANAIDTMVRGSTLTDASRLFDILAILVLGCVPALASLSASRVVRVAAVVAIAAAFLAAVQLAFQAGFILAVVAPLVTLAIAATSIAAIATGRAVRRRRS
jgi:CHASE2 domain-containing sensor protein